MSPSNHKAARRIIKALAFLMILLPDVGLRMARWRLRQWWVFCSS